MYYLYTWIPRSWAELKKVQCGPATNVYGLLVGGQGSNPNPHGLAMLVLHGLSLVCDTRSKALRARDGIGSVHLRYCGI